MDNSGDLVVDDGTFVVNPYDCRLAARGRDAERDVSFAPGFDGKPPGAARAVDGEAVWAGGVGPIDSDLVAYSEVVADAGHLVVLSVEPYREGSFGLGGIALDVKGARCRQMLHARLETTYRDGAAANASQRNNDQEPARCAGQSQELSHRADRQWQPGRGLEDAKENVRS